MALPIKTQLQFWSITLLVLIALLWLVSDVLAPFLFGMAIAYFMDPVADRLENLGLNRIMATVCIALITLLFTVLIVVLIMPQVTKQLGTLINVLPDYARYLWEYAITHFPALTDQGSLIRGSIDQFLASLQDHTTDVANTVLSYAISFVDMVIFLIITFVVAFYMLLDWDHMVAKVDGFLPRDHQNKIRQIARDLNTTMAGFVRGQISVCAILGTFYAIVLSLLGLQFGLIVGVIAGVLTFIPYVGALIGGCLAIGLALFQFWGQPEWIIAVAVVFFVGQFLEGNIITPRLIGNSVGLHPVWLLFTLSAFGSLLGFTGLLIAVPVTASIGVFVRFGLDEYRTSKLYTGTQSQPPADKDE